MDGLLLTASQAQMGNLAYQELQRLCRLVVDLRMEIDHKNQKLRAMANMNDKTCAELGKKIASLATEVHFILLEMNHKCSEAAATVKELLAEKDKLHMEYIKGRGDMQNLKKENERLRYELKLRSIKEENVRMKSELQLRHINAENERLNYELESKRTEFMQRTNIQQSWFMAEMKRLKYKVESETIEFELRLKQLEEHDVISKKEELEKMEGRTIKAEKESMHLKGQLEELQKRLQECLCQKHDLKRKSSTSRTENLASVKHLQEEHSDFVSQLHEPRKLESSHENIDLVKGKLSVEKGHRERVELELLGSSEIELQAMKLNEELSSCKMMIKEVIPGVSCSDDIIPKFAALQKEVPKSMVKAGLVNADLKHIPMQLDDSLEAFRSSVNGDQARWKQKYSRRRRRNSIPPGRN